MEVGDGVSVNLTGLHPILVQGAWINGVIVEIKNENEIVVEVPPVNGQSRFTVDRTRIDTGE